MCFVLYAASRIDPPLIPWNEQLPELYTSELSDDCEVVRANFTLPHVFYIGSHDGCGCGFRYIPLEAILQEDAEAIYSEGVEHQKYTQPNHRKLFDYIEREFKNEPFLELYGCWSGEEAERSTTEAEVRLDRIADPGFCFRERGFYRVLLK